MKYIGILLGLLLWPAACMAPPTYGPYPTGGGGLSSNEVYNIALSVGGPTNGISAATATNIVNNNNAATATTASLVSATGNAVVTNETRLVELNYANVGLATGQNTNWFTVYKFLGTATNSVFYRRLHLVYTNNTGEGIVYWDGAAISATGSLAVTNAANPNLNSPLDGATDLTPPYPGDLPGSSLWNLSSATYAYWATNTPTNLVYAASFSGSGSNLTGLVYSALPAGDITNAARGVVNQDKGVMYGATNLSKWNSVSGTLLSIGSGSDLDRTLLIAPTIVKVDGPKWGLYYGSYDANPGVTGRVFAAFGNLASGFVKHGPVLAPTPGSWDKGHIGGGRIYQELGTNYLYYFGGTNGGGEVAPEMIGVAYGTDGTNFTKYSGNPILTLGSTGQPDDNTMYTFCVVKNNGGYFGFYNGRNATNPYQETILMATASNPLGPWTKYSANPVFDFFGGAGNDDDDITSDPSVFPMPDGRWGMIYWRRSFGTYHLGCAYSDNLTNWVNGGLLTNSSGSISTPVAVGPWVFYDETNSLALVYSTSSSVGLLRPVLPNLPTKREQSFSAGQIFAHSGRYQELMINGALDFGSNRIANAASSINGVTIANGGLVVPGTLGVTGTTTMGTLVGTTIAGNGSGLTNIPLAGLYTNGATAGQVPTYQANATVVWSNPPAGGSGGGWTGNPVQFDSRNGMTNLIDGLYVTNPVILVNNFYSNRTIITSTGLPYEDDQYYLGYDLNLDTLRFGMPPIADGRYITNINAAYISGDLVAVSNIVAITLVADTFVGNGSGLTNLSGNGYRVKSFGAVGNGATDDTSAFEQTIATAATNTVKLVLVEPGRYVIKRPLYLPSNVTLQGFGASTVITKPTSVKCFVTNTVSAGAISVTLSNVSGFAVNDSIYLADTTSFEWLSTKAVITNISGNTISFNVPVVGSLQTARAGYVSTSFPLIRNLSDGTTNIVVTDIVLDQNSSTNDPANEFTVAAVHWQGTFYSTVRQSWLLNACGDAYSDQGTNGVGITAATNYIRKCHNTIESSVIRNAGRHGVHLGTCIEGGRVIGNTITKCGGFAYFYCAFTTYTVASGNLVDECLSGFAGIDQRDYGNTISGNTIKGCTNYSIDLASGGGDGTGGKCSIVGNTIFGRPIYSLQPECTFIGNAIHSSASTDGIRLGATADRSVVSGNTIYSGGGAGSSVMEIISADDVRIVGNIFNGSSKGINVQGCTRLVATGNTLTGMTSTFWLFNGAASTNIIINNELTTATTPVSETTPAVRLVYQGYGDNGTNDPAISGWWTNSDSRMWNGTMVIWTNASTTNVSMFIKGVGWRKLDP